jgi:hypothetical protein
LLSPESIGVLCLLIRAMPLKVQKTSLFCGKMFAVLKAERKSGIPRKKRKELESY